MHRVECNGSLSNDEISLYAQIKSHELSCRTDVSCSPVSLYSVSLSLNSSAASVDRICFNQDVFHDEFCHNFVRWLA